MYRDHFSLKTAPFSQSPDLRFFQECTGAGARFNAPGTVLPERKALFRHLHQTIASRPDTAGRLVIVIDEAQLLSARAVDALLKLLPDAAEALRLRLLFFSQQSIVPWTSEVMHDRPCYRTQLEPLAPGHVN